MSASYLLDENSQEDNVVAASGLQQGSEEDPETAIAPPHNTEPDLNEGLLHSKPVKSTPSASAPVLSPSTARFVPVNASSMANLYTPCSVSLPSAFNVHEGTRSVANMSEIRNLILTTSESIVMPSSKKRKCATGPTAATGRRKKEKGKKKEHPIIAGNEDLVEHQAQPKSASKSVDKGSLISHTTQSATALGQLSESTLNKLQAFKFRPHAGSSEAVLSISNHKPANEILPCQHLTSPQQDATTTVDENDFDTFDDFDEFDDTCLEDEVFDDFYDGYNDDHQTPDSTILVAQDSCEFPPSRKPNLHQATPVGGASQPQAASPLYIPLKRTQAPLSPPSPFLRSTLPHPAPAQSIIPSLLPHRRIPTLFRIAEVHRLLSTVSPTSPPPPRIELYASVIFSSRCRHTKAQEIIFADLFFPNYPPYIRGTYTAWQLGELFDEDSAPFLDTAQKRSKLCRAIVQITKKSQNGNSRISGGGSSPLDGPWSSSCQGVEARADALEAEVLSIWEACWEDVEYVKGIVVA